uniref:ATPase subunit 8 n=1 Tax=Pachyphlegyas modiglianii TaxID=2816051 RepID=A0A8T9ZWI8_9HEMI|nr:ATPase subunit 8 [Pachyphlegyas modiglianii]
MPHMAPMWWEILYMLFIFSFMFFLINTYWTMMKNYKIYHTSSTLNKINKNWKW